MNGTQEKPTMPQPQFARSIAVVDGKLTVDFPWDFPENVRAPYIDYAVTVLDLDLVEFYMAEATTKKINWYGFEKPPEPCKPYLTWL